MLREATEGVSSLKLTPLIYCLFVRSIEKKSIKIYSVWIKFCENSARSSEKTNFFDVFVR